MSFVFHLCTFNGASHTLFWFAGSLAAPTYSMISLSFFFTFPPLRTPATQAKYSVYPYMRSMFCVYRNVLFSVIHRDGDGVPDGYDNCVDLPNGEQADVDDDKIGIPVKEIVHFLSRERGCYSFQFRKQNMRMAYCLADNISRGNCED